MKPNSRLPNRKIYVLSAALLTVGLTGCWHKPAQVKAAAGKPETTVDKAGASADKAGAGAPADTGGICANEIDVNKVPAGSKTLADESEVVTGIESVWKLKSVRIYRSDRENTSAPISAAVTLSYDGKSKFTAALDCAKLAETKELKTIQGLVVDSISAQNGKMPSRYELVAVVTAVTPDVGAVKGAKASIAMNEPKLVDYELDGKPRVFSVDREKPVPIFEAMDDLKRASKVTQKMFLLSDGSLEVRTTFRGSDEDGKNVETASESMIYAPGAAE